MRLARYDTVAPTKAQRREFSCGAADLDRWLAERARQSMDSRDAVTYLLLDESAPDRQRIAGYFCLSAASVRRRSTPDTVARKAPESVPVVLMGRFAIDMDYQGSGWGADLLREALLSAVNAGRHIGARAMLVEAIDETAATFYRRYGFIESPIHPMQSLKSLADIDASTTLE